MSKYERGDKVKDNRLGLTYLVIGKHPEHNTVLLLRLKGLVVKEIHPNQLEPAATKNYRQLRTLCVSLTEPAIARCSSCLHHYPEYALNKTR